jgi:hypothetical protein
MNKPFEIKPVSGRMRFLIPTTGHHYQSLHYFDFEPDLSAPYFTVTTRLGLIDDQFITDHLPLVKIARTQTYQQQGDVKTTYMWALLDYGDYNLVVFEKAYVDIFTKDPEWGLAKGKEIYAKYKKDTREKFPSFKLVRSDGDSCSASTIKLSKSYPKLDEELVMHYGADFLQYRDEIFRHFNETDKGIHILVGEPGTGKTTFLRYMMGQAQAHHGFYFIPPEFYNDLGSTKLLDLLRSEQEEGLRLSDDEEAQGEPLEKKLFLVLEDSEALLLPRTAGNQSSFTVSELLNLSDGLLGEGLELHFLCTINCELRQLDNAITRPGRLLTSKRFAPLKPKEAYVLADHLNRTIAPDKSEYTLAEIYHSRVTVPSLKKNVGFTPA